MIKSRFFCATPILLVLLFSICLTFSACEGKQRETKKTESDKPCYGDPYHYPILARQRVSGLGGARFGRTRSGGLKSHLGLDLKITPGQPLYAMFDGYVFDVREDDVGDWGKYVIFLSKENGEPIYVMYAHVGRVLVRQGDVVQAGDRVATSGVTGNLKEAIKKGTVDPHVHIEIRKAVARNRSLVPYDDPLSTPLDPEDFMGTELDYAGRPKVERSCHQR